MRESRRSRYLIFFFLLLIVTPLPAWSQDLDSLRERATRLWAERLRANKAKAADFIEKEGRADFPMYENVREATVTALEFTSDKSKVRVTTKAKSQVPTIGTVDQVVIESWVWKSGNWFVQSKAEILAPFQAPGLASAANAPDKFTFQLIDKNIDLGAHKQGERISGTAKFVSKRSMLQVIRARGMDGFRVGATRWIDDSNGEMDFTIDSSLISQDIAASVALEAVGPQRVFEVPTVAEKLSLVGRIEGRIRISQLPQSPEAEKGRFVELEIQNVGNAAFRVEKIRPLDSNFLGVEGDIPEVRPGQTVKVAVSHSPQARLVDGEVMIQLSEGVLPSNSALFRIKGVATQNTERAQPRSDQAAAEALVRQAIQEAAERNARLKQP